MRIAIVNPNSTVAMTDSMLVSAAAVARPDTELIGITPQRGVPSIESHCDEVWGSWSVLTEVDRLEAAAARPDAYVIACFGDTGLPGAREAAEGPVVGMTEAAIMTAALIAHRFSIITMPLRTLEQSERVLRSLGLAHRCAVRAVDEPVSAVAHGSLHLLDTFAAAARRSLIEDSSEAIILGCAGLSDLVEPLRQILGAPVIEGVAAALTMAEGLVAQSLRTSRVNTWARATRPPQAVL